MQWDATQCISNAALRKGFYIFTCTESLSCSQTRDSNHAPRRTAISSHAEHSCLFEEKVCLPELRWHNAKNLEAPRATSMSMTPTPATRDGSFGCASRKSIKLTICWDTVFWCILDASCQENAGFLASYVWKTAWVSTIMEKYSVADRMVENKKGSE